MRRLLLDCVRRTGSFVWRGDFQPQGFQMTAGARKNNGQPRSVYILCLLAALLIWPAQHFFDMYSAGDDDDPDILLFSSPRLVKKMALGYDNLMADFYWMRTIQYYGRFDEADRRKIRYKNLYTLLDITTTLDPYYLDAYRTGCFFLAAEDPLGADQPEEALKLLDKGLSYHPEEWQLLYDKGFIYYWHLQDFRTAGETWLQAAAITGAPDWLSGLAAASVTRGGDLAVAIALWQDRFLQSTRENEKETALNRLISFKVAQDFWGWQALAEKYREENGVYPESLQILAEKHGLRYSLADPLGTPYEYDSQTGEVSLNDDTEVHYLRVPDIYMNSLVEAAPLTNLLPMVE
jgi:tetratricopeptide (TPR) repeat protein